MSELEGHERKERKKICMSEHVSKAMFFFFFYNAFMFLFVFYSLKEITKIPNTASSPDLILKHVIL